MFVQINEGRWLVEGGVTSGEMIFGTVVRGFVGVEKISEFDDVEEDLKLDYEEEEEEEEKYLDLFDGEDDEDEEDGEGGTMPDDWWYSGIMHDITRAWRSMEVSAEEDAADIEPAEEEAAEVGWEGLNFRVRGLFPNVHHGEMSKHKQPHSE